MKKRLLVLGMITCLFGLTACSGNADTTVLTEEEQAVAEVADSYISQVAEVVDQGVAEQYVAQDETLAPVFESWESGMEELGSYVETTGHKVSIDGDEVVVNVAITGSSLDPNGEARTADVEVIFNMKEYTLTSFSVNVNYTLAELMKNAALNTLIGMGTVFAVLILIIGVISLFPLIGKIGAASEKKEKKPSETAKSVDKTIARIVQTEEAGDNTELIAVISAAIAAYEAENGGYVSSDGVVIRSIRKVNRSKWQRA